MFQNESIKASLVQDEKTQSNRNAEVEEQSVKNVKTKKVKK